ncbi:tagaturonate epimerase family protein, partial [bacterium]|nr:tagaturonate epimerase family protein [bacterium]
EFNLFKNLKLSVHSGSDKFSLYDPIRNALKKFNAGLHLKTAGTTWLEEVTGLSEVGDDGLTIVKEIYRNAYHRFDELCKPYTAVINIDFKKLPDPDQTDSWDGPRFASALRHNPTDAQFNPHVRQLIHIGYKIAAEMKERYLITLKKYEKKIAQNVTVNIYENHLKRLFYDLVEDSNKKDEKGKSNALSPRALWHRE